MFTGKKDKLREKYENIDDPGFWEHLDVESMKRLDLKLALEARGLPTDGKKSELMERLSESIQLEKEEELQCVLRCTPRPTHRIRPRPGTPVLP